MIAKSAVKWSLYIYIYIFAFWVCSSSWATCFLSPAFLYSRQTSVNHPIPVHTLYQDTDTECYYSFEIFHVWNELAWNKKKIYKQASSKRMEKYTWKEKQKAICEEANVLEIFLSMYYSLKWFLLKWYTESAQENQKPSI